MKILFLFVWILCSFALWYIYHKLFVVFYTDVTMGCGKEIVVSGFLGIFLTALIFYYWYISFLIIALLIFAFLKKRN